MTGVGRAPRAVATPVLGLYAVISLYPFAWMVSGAFKDSREVVSGGNLVLHNPTLATMARTWRELDFLRYFGNSLLVTGATTAGARCTRCSWRCGSFRASRCCCRW